MPKIALVSSEPLRERVAGIGLRYLELARRLPGYGIDVVAVSPADPGETPLPEGTVRRFAAGRLSELLADCDGAVAQGQLANDLLLECPELPVAIDLYDPWLVENLHYAAELGLDPYRNDHATWVLQLSRGDFFLCSSDEQRLFYLGFLAALGRVNPRRLEIDPDLERLIAPVPFGVPSELPPHRPVLEPRPAEAEGAGPGPGLGEVRLLFGALYDWYDPWTLLDALALLPDRPWTLLFVRHPNPEGTPQRLLREVETRCRALSWWGSRVRAVDWVPFDRRYDLLRDVDLLVAPHRPSLETRLAMRTRFLDALAAGCPVVTSEGGALSRLLAEHAAGWVVPPGDPAALADALEAAIEEAASGAPSRHAAGAAALARRFSWDRVLAPLVAFCREPRVDPTKEEFAFRPPTVAPPDRPSFRVRRRLRRWVAPAPRSGGAA
jgi:glycosyltransferase involved in cell wall biosynthesis